MNMTLFSEHSIPDEAKMYLADLQRKGRQPSTIKRYAYDLEDFFLWLRASGNPAWKALSFQEIDAYLSFLKTDKKYSRRTIDRIFTVLKRFFSHCLELGLITNNPAATLKIENTETDELHKDDFISDTEADLLFRSIPSLAGLSENQLKSRTYLGERNLVIVTLFLHYGLTLAELVSLRMHHVHFEQKRIDIPSVSSVSRTVSIKKRDMAFMFSYYKNIPDTVQPKFHGSDPLFVAFDFQRNTYRWDYSTDSPKALTEIAVQKMLRQEVKRAGLRKGISAQHLRRTCILKMIQRGEPLETTQAFSGLKTKLSLKKYLAFSGS